MRLVLALAVATGLWASGAAAQSPLTDRTGFSLLTSEFSERGSFGTHARTEELGGLDSPDHHRFGIDVTALRRYGNGLAVGLRGGIYRYDPAGLGYRGGLTLGISAGLWRGGDVRIETETAYLQGRFIANEVGYTAAAVESDAAILLQQRIPLIGTVDLRPAVGPYATTTTTYDAWDVDGDVRPSSRYEQTVVHGGVQVGAAVTFALLDTRVAVAPVTRFPLVESDTPASFSALPGGGIWVDF
ncbi:MAG: hypothetical protein AAFQ43_08935 [Bacteroidota bacterium]